MIVLKQNPMKQKPNCSYHPEGEDQCANESTAKWGDHWFCNEHAGSRAKSLWSSDISLAFETCYYKLHTTDGFFPKITSVRTYDDSTLFCPAGMQRFANYYKDPSLVGMNKTTLSQQACLRVNDLDFLGDGSHLAYFNMLGLFSFGELTMKQAIHFWLSFLHSIDPNKKIQRITIHPEKFEEWKLLYPESLYDIIVPDSECVWSDGKEASGFCTEFYIDGIEVGNIVNTNGTMIDCGFGLERLEHVYHGKPMDTEVEALQKACRAIIDAGYAPGSKKQGHVLRKLLNRLQVKGGTLDHEYFYQEVIRRQEMRITYERHKHKHLNKPPEWWLDTYGVDVTSL